ncbi:MAG: tRNA lysidine(34) synthetase TilS [Fidelibacterota bacterium]
MPDLLEQFRTHLASTQIIPRGSRGVVAVSGGVDSVVLLHLLTGCSESMGLDLHVAHFNHGTRGRESDGDEAFVKELAGKWGLKCTTSRVKAGGIRKGESPEAGARELRYGFLESVRSKEQCDWIATAHHADDQVETVIMRLAEGTGIQGLKGIRSRQGFLVRPLLPFGRNQIEAYAAAHRLPYRHDSTNDDISIPRNFVRHRIVPALRELNPSLSSAVSRLVANVEEVNRLVENEVEEWYSRTVSLRSSREMVVDGKRLMESPSVVRKGLIRRLTGGNDNGGVWRRRVWNDLDDFLRRSRTGQRMVLPGGWEMLRDRDRFLLRETVGGGENAGRRVEIRAGERTRLTVGPFEFTLDPVPRPGKFDPDPSVEYVDGSLLDGADLCLRTWQAGDRMKPLGLTGFKKVSDLLVDEKIDGFTKESQFVLTVNGEIAWLCGIRLDDRFKVTSKTPEVVRLGWRPVQR